MVIRNPLIGLAAAAICTTVFGASASAQPTAPAAGCTELGGTVQANQKCHIQTKTATYSIEISYPPDYSDQSALTDFVKQDRKEFVYFAAAHPPRDRPYERDVGSHMYTSGTATSGTQSVVLELYGDSGGAHPVTGFQSFNYDVSAHRPITFDTLFKPGVDPVAVLDPIVQRQMDKRWQSYGGPAPRNTLGARVYQNFALTDDAVIFYISQGMWLAEVAGPQTISVPRSGLTSALAQKT
jgi:hypothetical protein